MLTQWEGSEGDRPGTLLILDERNLLSVERLKEISSHLPETFRSGYRKVMTEKETSGNLVGPACKEIISESFYAFDVLGQTYPSEQSIFVGTAEFLVTEAFGFRTSEANQRQMYVFYG
ncbi:hypothetical protein GALMADRAFT_248249 [Galerina marginata CBS 339.88]|uniref:Uncharacterized protein n=1 Tax=Galerina marginata (strain CBS 339.88) TaxID=685588 RepID=A0A067SXM6_GALM3|nr:hypothetical protein GALMADRAFT_248249 [Galerina marginata CBS 339.88]